MKNKILGLTMVLIVTMVTGGFINPEPAKAVAVIINDCDDLIDISSDLDADYELGGNIDCSGVVDFDPLGNFTGTLDGKDYVISNLTMSSFITNTQGLFNVLDGATVKNLTIDGAILQTNYQGGILAGRSDAAQILNVHVSGTVNSTAELSVTGGLVGQAYDTGIYLSSADVDITAYELVGGLVGVAEGHTTISRSFAVGSITELPVATQGKVGGLVGANIDSSTIDNCYAVVDITSVENNIGGLVGSNESNSRIYNSYSAGAITSSQGKSKIGGLVGAQTGGATTADSYWDKTASGRTTSTAGYGRNTAQMQTEATFIDWDFDDTWVIDPGEYPSLLPYDDTTPVITEVTPIPSSTSAKNAAYYFSTNKPGTFLVEGITIAGGHNDRVESKVDPDLGKLYFEGLVAGHTYSTAIAFIDFGGIVSNSLTVGPFTVKSAGSQGGSVARKDADGNPLNSVMPVELPTVTTPTRPAQLGDLIGNTFAGVGNWLPRNLRFGMRGADVKLLQQWLNSHGFKLADSDVGSPGQETDYFGPKLLAAVIRLQKANGINPAAGFVGPITRALIIK